MKNSIRKHRFDIITDVQSDHFDALAIIDNETGQIVQRGILPANGHSSWAAAKTIRDRLNNDVETVEI